jgi:hypothetical protein
MFTQAVLIDELEEATIVGGMTDDRVGSDVAARVGSVLASIAGGTINADVAWATAFGTTDSEAGSGGCTRGQSDTAQ